MTVISLQAEIDARRQRPGTEADHKSRCVDDPWEPWLNPIEACRARSHRSVAAFEASRNNRQLPRFLREFKGDAGRDPLNSLCQFGAVCAATHSAVLAAWATAIVLAADTLLNQSQVILAHASSLLREIHSRKGDGNCLSPIHRSSPGVHP